MAKAKVVYGGPYSQESDAITTESTKENPDYTQLTADWKTISQGALDYIQSLIKPKTPKPGPFVNNAVIDYENEKTLDIPDVADFDRDREKLGLGDLLEDAPVEDKEEKSNDVDLDKL